MLNRTIGNDDLWNTFVVRLWLKLWENHGKLHTNLIFCVWNFKCKSSGAHSLRDARRLDCLYGFKTKINWNIGRIECIEQYIYVVYTNSSGNSQAWSLKSPLTLFKICFKWQSKGRDHEQPLKSVYTHAIDTQALNTHSISYTQTNTQYIHDKEKNKKKTTVQTENFFSY